MRSAIATSPLSWLYRLDRIRRANPDEAFSGEGGLYAAGRWNSVGQRIVYASSSAALACLETLNHIATPQQLEERWLFAIEIPDEFIEKLDPLPEGWNAEPAGNPSRREGDRWLIEARSAGLLVPSAIIPMEKNVVINPQHPSFRIEWVRSPIRFSYDRRLR